MALPGGHAIPGDGPEFDSDVDIILIIQERDAYKKETEKLRGIVDRQRFIIKSLQDQLVRVQSASAANTPSLMNSELSPELPAQQQQQQPQQHQRSSEPEALPNDAASSRNALGLSSLDVDSLPAAAQAERKVSQGALLGALPARAPNAAVDGHPAAQASGRPWAKSTRLSEIYADYSARHNSVAPMFKASAAPWTTGTGESTQHQHQQQHSEPLAGGSSFVESLKTSAQRTEWLAEWSAPTGQSDASDLSSDGRISSLALESSREQSVSIDVGDRQGLRANALGLQGPVPTVPSVAANQSASPASPASEAISEDLVLRPVSLIASHSIAEPSRHDDAPPSADLTDERSPWRASRVDDYEYQALDMATLDDFGGETRPAEPDVQATQAPLWQRQEQQLEQLEQQLEQQQQQQEWHRPSNDALASDHNAGVGVRWAMDAETPSLLAAATSPIDQRVSRSRADSSQQSDSGSVAQSSAGTSSARARSDSRSGHEMASRADSSSFDAGAMTVPQGPVSMYSTASTAKNTIPPGPPLTSLQNIGVQIKDSRVKIDERGKEVNVYMIDVVWRKEITGLSLQEILVESPQSEVVLWTVEKRYSDFLNLNGQLRHVIHRERLLDRLERLPDKDIFRPNAPNKSDKRKLWFEKYLRKALSLGLSDKRPLLEFLSSDRTMEPEKKMPILLGHKEGFLVKKGKNFGGWKRRYYVCKSNRPILEYSETPGGAIIGAINLSGAVVKTGKVRADDPVSLRARSGSKEADMFRHAFLIEEQPKREGRDTISHPLWADSDRECDEWVMALRYVIVRDSDGPERAMKEVAKLVKHAKSKQSKPLMIHQIQTSMTHEQGVRRSAEHARQREEQHNGAGAAEPRGTGKFGSPLSRQMWPHNAPPAAATAGAAAGAATEFEADADANAEQLYDTLRVNGHAAATGAAAGQQPSADAQSTRPSPAAIATTLSTSFAGYSDSLSDQAEHYSVHYVASEISTIESSIYSSYNGNSGSSRPNDMSSRSIDDRNSYASAPDSPRSPVRPAGAGPPRVAASDYWAPVAAQRPPPDLGQARSQFTKNSVGRIVHEEESAPDLPKVTPRVTDDILGIGRQEPGRSNSSGSGADRPARTREDKKRGRITFMWGKRKPTESEPPLPDLALSKSGGGGGQSAGGPAAASRLLRRGSTSNNTRSSQARGQPFKGPVFGGPLELAVDQTWVREHYHLPAVVYRCIEYLDAKMACLEEGIYRQSGSSVELNLLRKEFDTNRDYNLMKLSKPPDVHAVASLLKAYLRDLPENILTAQLHQEFARVVDLAERHDRVDELGRLVSDLPLANYTLLRALTAHLIRIVQKANTNRMTLRNIGIVFSPSLGIPVGIFSLLMVEFEYIFWVNDSGVPEPRILTHGAAAVAADSDEAYTPPPYLAGSRLSASVPSGIDKVHDGDPAPHMDHGASGADPASTTDAVAHASSVAGSTKAAGALAPWYAQLDAEAGGAAGLSQDLSRYPGMAPSHSWQHTAQQEAAQAQGRSNRNSIQYKVGAPRELISQEAGMLVPETITESDFDEDDFDDRISPGGDPMMRLNRYDSSSMLQDSGAARRN
ncbi:Rho GTPase activating protein [Coemansia biformis]|uniref:Rho GTPase activating protein n=1 Tax=Coemansia biformis TaxID=1286918 RepID=A0A9W7YFX7_9FUNG|nr:Rho GTPase activating protein [Coemansia biformis]